MVMAIHDGARPATRYRKTLRCRAELQTARGSTIAVRTIDISTTGMSVVAQQALLAGASCNVGFALPKNGALQSISTAAVVLYCSGDAGDGFRLGLRFTEADQARNGLINALR